MPDQPLSSVPRSPPPPAVHPPPYNSQARTLLYQKLLCSLNQDQNLNFVLPPDVPDKQAELKAFVTEWKEHLEQALAAQSEHLLESFERRLSHHMDKLRHLHDNSFKMASLQTWECFQETTLPHTFSGFDHEEQLPCNGGQEREWMVSPQDSLRVDSPQISESRDVKRKSILKKGSSEVIAYDKAKAKAKQAGPREKERISLTQTPPSLWQTVRQKGLSAAALELINRWQFEIFVVACIGVNSLLLGIQVELTSKDPTIPESETFLLFQVLFVLIFSCELVIRLVALGWRFFHCSSDDYLWNYSDFTIVLLSVLECILSLSSLSSGAMSGEFSNLRVLRITRITRVVRAIRIIRLVRFVRDLRKLVSSIASTMRPLLWAMSLLVMIIYVFGTMFTDVVNSHFYVVVDHLDTLSVQEQDDHRVLQQNLGTLHSSMHTLLQCVSGGMDWAEVANPLMRLGVVWGYLFVAYVSFCTFAVLNVMTGVFCDAAIQAGRADQISVLQDITMDKVRMESRIRNLFNIISRGDPEQGITLADIEAAFENEKVATFFQSLELDCNDAWTLFKLIDKDGDAKLDAEEFLKGCFQLKGAAKCIDLKVLMRDFGRLQEIVHDMQDETTTILQDIKDRLGMPAMSRKRSCDRLATSSSARSATGL